MRKVVVLGLLLFISTNFVYARQQIPAKDVIAFDKNNNQRNLQDILDQIVPTNATTDLTTLTASADELNVLDGVATTLTASELNILDGISANVTAANLNELTGGGQTSLHSHAGGGGGSSSSTTTLNQAYTNDAATTRIIDLDKGAISFNLTDNTNDYGVIIDNTTTGTINDALLIRGSSTGAVTDAIDVSDAEIVNAINMGDNTFTGTRGAITLTNFTVVETGVVRATGINLTNGTAGVSAGTIDFGSGAADDLTAADVTDLTDGGETTLHSHAGGGGSSSASTLTDAYANNGTMILDGADFVVSLSDATNDYKMVIDNTTTGTINDALLIRASSTGAITEAIDVSDAEIVAAINIGANQITGDSFKFDGVGQLEIGKGGGGGGGRGTGILTFIGGGAIDTTQDGDIVIQPDDAGIVDFPAGTTVRLPPASPLENRDGLYWDELNDKLCIDKANDLCTAALSLSAVSLNSSDVKTVKDSIPLLASLVSSFEKANFPSTSSKISLERRKMAAFLGLSSKQVDKLFTIIDDDETEKKKPISYLYDRGEAQLVNGIASIALRPEFLEVVEIDKNYPLIVQVTPLTSDIQGILVVSQRSNEYFVVEEANGGKSNAWFMWEVSAKEKDVVKMKHPPKIEFENKQFVAPRD